MSERVVANFGRKKSFFMKSFARPKSENATKGYQNCSVIYDVCQKL